MHSVRTTETVMLGYTIERVDSVDSAGLAWNTTYQVLGAEGDNVLGGEHDTLRAAQNFVLWHELEIARQRDNARLFYATRARPATNVHPATPKARTAHSRAA